MVLPAPEIRTRPVPAQSYDYYITQGLDPLLARLLAARVPADQPELWGALLYPRLAQLSPPGTLKDIEKATKRLLRALERQEIIALETDHDCDGQTAHAVLYTALVEYFGHPAEKVLSFIGHRLEEGYGLSEKLMHRILAHEPRPQLLITADNGSSDGARIERLAQEGIDVIVTDHHEIPSSGIPSTAYAVINPARTDCSYPDKAIAGCMVAWLLMAQVRQALEAPSLAPLLDFVAVGTIADCVSLASSVNNRAVVRAGMRLIAQGTRPCWRAILPLLKGPLCSEDLGFVIGPLLNSDGRLSDALTSVSFLLAQTDKEAQDWVVYLSAQNEQRKGIQKQLTTQAFERSAAAVLRGDYTLCLYLKEGHSGVHGISASRIKDAFGRPTVIFSPKQGVPGQITGSARSVDGVHIRRLFERVAERMEKGIVAFGGHKGAAGITLEKEAFERFQLQLEQVAREEIAPTELGPVVWTDGLFAWDYWDIEVLESWSEVLEPFGRAFEPPAFHLKALVTQLQPVGDGTHLRVHLAEEGGGVLETIWFGARMQASEALPIALGLGVDAVVRLRIQSFRGIKKLSAQILSCQPCQEES